MRFQPHLSDEAIDDEIASRMARQERNEAREQEKRDANEARQVAESERQLEHLKAKALRGYLRAGGTRAGFEEDWPDIERGLLIKATIEDGLTADSGRSSADFG